MKCFQFWAKKKQNSRWSRKTFVNFQLHLNCHPKVPINVEVMLGWAKASQPANNSITPFHWKWNCFLCKVQCLNNYGDGAMGDFFSVASLFSIFLFFCQIRGIMVWTLSLAARYCQCWKWLWWWRKMMLAWRGVACSWCSSST